MTIALKPETGFNMSMVKPHRIPSKVSSGSHNGQVLRFLALRGSPKSLQIRGWGGSSTNLYKYGLFAESPVQDLRMFRLPRRILAVAKSITLFSFYSIYKLSMCHRVPEIIWEAELYLWTLRYIFLLAIREVTNPICQAKIRILRRSW
jgi:hypothetical protein